MAFKARILLDSVNEWGDRLTTMVCTIPRIVLAEFNTHRVFSRNSASSRAIPFSKQVDRVFADPFVPVEFGRNQRGMQAGAEVEDRDVAVSLWLEARDRAVEIAGHLNDHGVHKQHVNRLLEPFMWHEVIVTSSHWANFFGLRCSPMAQPEIRVAAELMRDAYEDSTPKLLGDRDWHLPFYNDGDERLTIDARIKASVGRCARVSYLTHDGERDVAADIGLHDRLMAAGHMSPFEHVATPCEFTDAAGNFAPGHWLQYRKVISNEAVYLGGSA